MNQDRYESGKALYQNGLDGSIHRHHALMAISYYLVIEGFLEPERVEMMTGWMEAKHNGYSKQWFQNPKGVIREIKGMCMWSPEKRHIGISSSSRFGKFNLERDQGVQDRIIQAVPELLKTGKLFKKKGRLNLSVISKVSGVSRDYLRDHYSKIHDLVLRKSGKIVLAETHFRLSSFNLFLNPTVEKAPGYRECSE